MRQPVHGERDMSLFEIARLDAGASDETCWLRRRWPRAGEARESSFDFRHHGLVLDCACRRHHHVGAPIVAAEIGGEPRAVERAHGCRRAEDGPTDRLVSESGLLQLVPDEIVRRILGGTDLLHDHVLLAPQLLGIERWIGEDVGQHVKRKRHVSPQNARVVGGCLNRGCRVEVAADRLDLLRDLTGGAPRSSLERHMLEQMRDTMLVWPRVAAAGTDPHAKRGGLQMRHRVSDNNEAGGKTRDLDAHAAAPSCAARLAERIWRSIAIWSTGSVVTRSGRRSRSASHSGSGGRTPQAASTASGNLAGWAVPSTTIGIDGSRVSFSATATPTAVWGSIKCPVSRSIVRIVAAVSFSSALSAENTARSAESACAESANRRD